MFDEETTKKVLATSLLCDLDDAADYDERLAMLIRFGDRCHASGRSQQRERDAAIVREHPIRNGLIRTRQYVAFLAQIAKEIESE